MKITMTEWAVQTGGKNKARYVKVSEQCGRAKHCEFELDFNQAPSDSQAVHWWRGTGRQYREVSIFPHPEWHTQSCFARSRAGFTLSYSIKKDRTVRQHAQQEAGGSQVAMETGEHGASVRSGIRGFGISWRRLAEDEAGSHPTAETMCCFLEWKCIKVLVTCGIWYHGDWPRLYVSVIASVFLLQCPMIYLGLCPTD